MNGKYKVHRRLKQPLVNEALLEVRYPMSSALPYGFVPGRLYEALKSTFPKLQELPVAQLPVEATPEHLVRHRFLTDDDSRMFQVGAGVLSINHVKYNSFSDFAKDCRKVLNTASELGLLSKIERIGLRYINTALLDRPINKIIDIKIEVPPIIVSDLQGQMLRWFTRFSHHGTLSTTIAWPVEGGGIASDDLQKHKSLLIDLDFFIEPKADLSLDHLIEWLYQSHAIIFEVFKSSLCSEYFRELERSPHVKRAK